ncbi:hypothetical protein [Nostoc sp.]|uniref:hypothetical protein n=1 Tax=Nostoc sp. TaxID=1180 RepID=UPI002FFABE3B
MTIKAKRASIQLAGIEVEVFQMPNGDYVMSQTQAAEAIGVSSSCIFSFLHSNYGYVLLLHNCWEAYSFNVKSQIMLFYHLLTRYVL